MLRIILLGIVLNFSWAANPPADNVKGYRLKFGPGDGSFPIVVDVGNVTAKDLDVDLNTQRAVEVTAYNGIGLESDASPAVTIRPKVPAALTVALPASH